jgi:predicted esterase
MMTSMHQAGGLHQGNPILRVGKSLAEAQAAMVMLHGRGASARDILALSEELHNDKFAYLAPQATNFGWYPHSFLAPIEDNEPWLSSALNLVAEVLNQVSEAGVPVERAILLGFSQGACLASEYVARNPRRYGGLIAFSGGLIGPEIKMREYPGTLEGTPVFLGCSDVDPHIPKERVQETVEVLRAMGAEVTAKLYAGMGHTVNRDEIEHAREIMNKLVGG